jgi:hypothetical protein
METTADKVIISAEIRTEMRDELLRRAVLADRSLSAQIRRAIAEHLGHDDNEEEA